jgi:hypothetical protein
MGHTRRILKRKKGADKEGEGVLSMRLRSTPFLVLAALFLLPMAQAGRVMEPKEFDRLDGHGASHKKVDVIEWEGNLELHFYPQGSLRSLAMKIDHESKTTKNNVMVIEYGFNGVPYTMIRRAILSINLPDQFFTFRDTSAEGYDKIIISGNQIAGATPYPLQPGPTQLYPDYHPALAQEDPAAPAQTYGEVKNEAKEVKGPSPAAERTRPGIQFRSADEVQQDDHGTVRRRSKDSQLPSGADSDGSIRSFAF